MTGYQLLIILFGSAALATSLWAVYRVARSQMRFKALWIAGSLFGFVGLGVNWTSPEDLFLLFGLQIPPVFVFKLHVTGIVIVKVQFPIVALLALE